MLEVLANATVVIILQYIKVSNQHVVHLKLTQCCMSIISQLKKDKSWQSKKFDWMLKEEKVL